MRRAPSRTPLPIPLSAVEGAVWPAPAGGMQAVTLAALQQLEHSQYLPQEELQARQFRQLSRMVAHAAKALPFYREHFRRCGFDPAAPIDAARWATLPILTRQDVQAAGAALHCRNLPKQHGETTTDRTSGSTGTALTVLRSALTLFYWNVFAIREVAWHGFDLAGKLAAIRMDWQRPAGSTGLHVKRHANWGPPLASLYPTGPAAVLDIRHTTIAEQAKWLQNEAPDHLVGFGVGLHALARYCLAHDIHVASIRSVYSQGEVLSEAAREACRAAWGVEIVDNYSAVETGFIAVQCPDFPHLHAQAESALVEILAEDGSPCRPGEIGRVVVTPLHNFAMPLIRYAIGDLAEAGEACACGRTLPVLKRILGRTRDMLMLPNGEYRFPFYGSKALGEFPTIIQHQLIQKSVADIELRLVARAQLSVDEEARLHAALVAAIGHPFRIATVYCDAIERSAGGKYVEFKCEVAR